MNQEIQIPFRASFKHHPGLVFHEIEFDDGDFSVCVAHLHWFNLIYLLDQKTTKNRPLEIVQDHEFAIVRAESLAHQLSKATIKQQPQSATKTTQYFPLKGPSNVCCN